MPSRTPATFLIIGGEKDPSLTHLAKAFEELGYRTMLRDPGRLDSRKIGAADAVLLCLYAEGVSGWESFSELKADHSDLPVAVLFKRETELFDERAKLAECCIANLGGMSLVDVERLARLLLRGEPDNECV